MGRRSFSREFKLEAVRLVRERGVSVAQAARDLDLHQNMLRNWVRDFAANPAQAFPGQAINGRRLHLRRAVAAQVAVAEVVRVDEDDVRLLRRTGRHEERTIQNAKQTEESAQGFHE